MRQVMIVGGRAVVEDVPAPVCDAGSVLVRVQASCISAGTELSGARTSGQAMWKVALSSPRRIKRGMELLATKGVAHTRRVVKGQLESGRATGYSVAGVVLEVGEGVHDVKVGDRVACAGAGYANHAEIVCVPRNLVVAVPRGLSMSEAATVTLGAIALQGVRRAEPTLGETFVVLGLGVVGQLCAQLLRANGCQVVGSDIDQDRVELAKRLGAGAGLHPDLDDDVEAVIRLTDGVGADGVIVCAASPSDEIVSGAFRMCRKKGRVVLVGDVGLALDRADFYEKELDFLISTSYGPGRYDRTYEEEGLDYPVSYVRWTENRNMAAYLRQLTDGRVRVEPLVSSTYSVSEAADAYEALERGGELMVLLTYAGTTDPLDTVTHVGSVRPGRRDRVNIAVIGAGSFAKSEHLPNLQSLSDRCRLHAIVSRSGGNAMDVARREGAAYATTEIERVLADDDVDAVLIATRHDLHARIALDALRAGKHVYVEKPLALNREELGTLERFFDDVREGPVLMTGFNRRFSRHGRRIAELVAARAGPVMMSYRMNAGYVPQGNWVHGTEGGGRNIGEACHIYDLFTFLTGGQLVDVTATSVRAEGEGVGSSDNFAATVSFDDGSVATLIYTALGSPSHPKEQAEVFSDGRVVSLDDYRKTSVAGSRARGVVTKRPDKGHRDALSAFVGVIRSGGEWPIPLWQQVQAMEIAFRVEDSLGPGTT